MRAKVGVELVEFRASAGGHFQRVIPELVIVSNFVIDERIRPGQWAPSSGVGLKESEREWRCCQ